VAAVELCRDQRDFSERERLLLSLARPHLCQAASNAEAFARVRGGFARGLESSGGAVVALAPDGRVRVMSPAARARLAAYFGAAPRRGDRLPEMLDRWVRHHVVTAGRTDDLPPPRVPLVIEGEGRRLVVRLLQDQAQPLALLDEQQTASDPAALERFALTRREAEVLAWVAEGKPNADIGTILGARPRTVAKHLERIYQKLGVETRVAAAAIALKSAPSQ
jgi:DNA-binding CsgD family transcriptional regulator